MSGVSLKNIKKKFGSLEVIKGIDINIRKGEFCVFVGPSGCGKSTLLRMIAGLEEITDGEIKIGDRIVNEIDASKRKTAMVFQTYALYPHMSVERNMGFGLLMNGVTKNEVKSRVTKAAKILKIDLLMDRKPRQLSGGQRQRVAIGRAIVREPEVFLFDEPLSNLDAELRVATRLEIAKLHQTLEGSTMVYVTHDQVEAMTLADQIVVLRDGLVEQSGPPLELYENPKNLFVAGFIGSPKINLIEIEDGKMPDGKKLMLKGTNFHKVSTIGIRADALVPVKNGLGIIRGNVRVVERLGDVQYVHFTTDWGRDFVARFPPDKSVKEKSIIEFSISGKSHFFDSNGKVLRNVELKNKTKL
jgi:ABC-type sugar transport system ATPase subunit